MKRVRVLLDALEMELGGRLGEHLATKSIVLRVDESGRPYIGLEERLASPVGRGVFQAASRELVIDLLAEYEPDEGLRGPHLLAPRPSLRIIPGKLGGEPHVEDTRIETRGVAALRRRGYTQEEILEFYPFLNMDSIAQAVDLEDQLDRNLGRAVA